MPQIKMKDLAMHTYEGFPKVGQTAPNFALTKIDLSTTVLSDYANKTVLLNIYPSIDTQVCFNSVKHFNENISHQHNNVIIACVSMDLPFALKRIGEAEKFENIELLSDFRNREFGNTYGLTIADGPLAGLLARAIIIIDPQQKIVYTELVKDITNPPNYEEALKHIK